MVQHLANYRAISQILGPTPPPLKERGTYQFSFVVEFKDKPEMTRAGRRSREVRPSETVACHTMRRAR